MNQFVLSTPMGERYATLLDLPLTRAGEAMVIGALRDGFAISYEEDPTTTPVNREASPVATKTSRKARRGHASDPLATREDTYAIGDAVYLAWSEIEAKHQMRLSQYRMTKGVVAEFQSGFRSIGVRFNGDPDVIWLRRRELARVPEVG